MGANASKVVGRRVYHCSGGEASPHGKRVVNGVTEC